MDGTLYNTVIPALGTLTSNLIALSPLQPVLACIRSGSIGLHNPLPYPLIMSNSLTWILYSLLIKNAFIFWSNIAGWLLGLFFTLSIYGLLQVPSVDVLSGSQKRQQDRLLVLVLGGNAFVFLGAFLSFIQFRDDKATAATETQVKIMGYVSITVLVLFYGSPLSTLVEVIRTRNSASFQWMLCITCFLNALLWTAYGYAIEDPFVSGPNAVGVAVALIQVICKLLYPELPVNRFRAGTGSSFSPLTGSPD